MKTTKLYAGTSMALETLRMVLEVGAKMRLPLGPCEITTERPQRHYTSSAEIDLRSVTIKGSFWVDKKNHPITAWVLLAEERTDTYVRSYVLTAKCLALSIKRGGCMIAIAEYDYVPTGKMNPPTLVVIQPDDRTSDWVYGSCWGDANCAHHQGFGSSLAQFSILKSTPRASCYFCRTSVPVANMQEGNEGRKRVLICKDHGCKLQAEQNAK